MSPAEGMRQLVAFIQKSTSIYGQVLLTYVCHKHVFKAGVSNIQAVGWIQPPQLRHTAHSLDWGPVATKHLVETHGTGAQAAQWLVSMMAAKQAPIMPGCFLWYCWDSSAAALPRCLAAKLGKSTALEPQQHHRKKPGTLCMTQPLGLFPSHSFSSWTGHSLLI